MSAPILRRQINLLYFLRESICSNVLRNNGTGIIHKDVLQVTLKVCLKLKLIQYLCSLRTASPIKQAQ